MRHMPPRQRSPGPPLSALITFQASRARRPRKGAKDATKPKQAERSSGAQGADDSPKCPMPRPNERHVDGLDVVAGRATIAFTLLADIYYECRSPAGDPSATITESIAPCPGMCILPRDKQLLMRFSTPMARASPSLPTARAETISG